MSLAHLFTSRSPPGHHSTSDQSDLQPSEGINLAVTTCEVYRTHLGTYLEALLRNVDEWAGPSSHRPVRSTRRRYRNSRLGLTSLPAMLTLGSAWLIIYLV